MKNLLKTTLIILLISFFGCKKEFEKELNKTDNIEYSALSIAYYPNNVSGRLVFPDWFTYHKYIYDLETELDLINGEEDSVLYYIETLKLNNFYSLRQDLMILNGMASSGNWIDTNAEFSTSQIQTQFECDFIVDDIAKSTFNNFHEIQVGDSVYVAYSSKYTLRIHKDDFHSINNLRNIEKCDGELLISHLNPNIFVISESEDNPEGNGVTFKCGDFTNEAGQELKMGSLECPVSCEQFSMKFFADMQYVSSTTTIGGIVTKNWSSYGPLYNITIDFGDGSPIANVTNTGVKHTYGGVNTYTVIYTIDYEDSPDDGIVDIKTATCTTQVEISEAPPCSSEEAEHQDSKANEDWSMSYKLKLVNRKYRKVLIGWTRAWKQKSNGKWKNRRTKMTTNVDGSFRVIGNCETILKKPKNHKENKCRRKLTSRAGKFDKFSFKGPKTLKKAVQYIHWSVADKDCYSFHRLDNRNISKTVYLVLCQ